MCVQNHNAQFTCEITGEPTPSITWYKGAREISNGARYHIYNDGDTYNLTINDVFGEDADEYICRASNKGGVKSTRAELIIMSMCCARILFYLIGFFSMLSISIFSYISQSQTFMHFQRTIILIEHSF